MTVMGPSWISDQNDFSYIDLLVTPMLLIKFQDNWPVVSGEEKQKIEFQDGGNGSHLRFSIGTILAFFC